MLNRPLNVRDLIALSLAATSLFWVGTIASAQSTPQVDKAVQNNDTTRRDLAQFDRFLDTHPEIAEQVRKDPSLADNQKFVKAHPALQTFLEEQPGVREELKENPNAFMRQEDAFDRSGDKLDGDRTRGNREEFDRFLNSHPETAEQLRKNPSLANNAEFLKTHPALQTYLREQPSIRQDIRDNPTAFMRQEDTFDHRDYGRDRSTTNEQTTSFREFLGAHANISDQLSRDPSLVKNHEYVQNHPELQAYLNANPDVRDHLMANPQGVVNAQPQFNKTPGNSNGYSSVKPSATTSAPAPTTTPTPNPSPNSTHNPGSK